MTFLHEWDYDLPTESIATRPAERRDGSKLMCLSRMGNVATHHGFSDLPQLLREGDLLIGNDTRVMAARIYATRATGGRVEFLLLEPGPGEARALARPARRLKVGERLELDGGGTITLLAKNEEDGTVQIIADREFSDIMDQQGEMPLPPYMNRGADAADCVRYQTVFAGPLGASAAPTAGLHFCEAVFEQLAARGVSFETLTLHVGVGTFRNLRPEDIARGRLHEEHYHIPERVVQAIARTRAGGGRVIGVGTTSTRALEAATSKVGGPPRAGWGVADLFIQPSYEFRVIDGLITNFHLPKSSLLFLVGAFIGRERLLKAYEEALSQHYRFYSYGDAMLLL